MKPQAKALNPEGPLLRGMMFGGNLSPELPVGGKESDSTGLGGGSIDPWSTNTEPDGPVIGK